MHGNVFVFKNYPEKLGIDYCYFFTDISNEFFDSVH
jgi:hypothetical protein